MCKIKIWIFSILCLASQLSYALDFGLYGYGKYGIVDFKNDVIGEKIEYSKGVLEIDKEVVENLLKAMDHGNDTIFSEFRNAISSDLNERFEDILKTDQGLSKSCVKARVWELFNYYCEIYSNTEKVILKVYTSRIGSIQKVTAELDYQNFFEGMVKIFERNENLEDIHVADSIMILIKKALVAINNHKAKPGEKYYLSSTSKNTLVVEISM